MNDEHELTELEKKLRRRGRLIAAAIMLTVMLPMVVAYVVFFTGVGVPQGTVNKGVLIDPPQSINELSLQALDGVVWNIEAEPKRWRWIIPGHSDCNQQCQDNLYLTRQVHIRLAEKAARVERLYLLLDDHMEPSTIEFINKEHPHMPILKAAKQQVNDLFARSNLPADAINNGHYFLMDQEGFIMMTYHPQHQGKELLDDIKRMLKYSYEE